MVWLRRLLLMLPWIRHQREESLDEEMESHMMLAADEARQDNLPAEDARFEAKRDFGSSLRVKEQIRREWFFPGVERIGKDLQYACRTLARSPLYTAVAVLSLALGVGAATAAFSLVNGVLLKPLAYPDAGRLVYVREFVPALAHVYPTLPVNIQHFFYWHEHSTAFDSLTALRSGQPTVAGPGEPVRVEGLETTAGLFKLLRVEMARGRGFVPGEDQPGKNHVAVMTDSLWRRMGAKPDAVGTNILVDGIATTVVGVLPRSFTFPTGKDLGPLAGSAKRAEIILPLQNRLEGWDGDYDFVCIGRLKAGVAPAQGQADLKRLTAQFTATYHVDSKPRPALLSLQEAVTGSVRISLPALLAAVLTLLLIVCVNLANLTLARSNVREREFSIRTALGAGRARLLRQVITETTLLCFCGGGLGVVLAAIAIRMFVAAGGVPIPRLDEVTTDGRVLAFALLTTMVCAILSGVGPALRMTKANPQEALKNGVRTASAGAQSLRLRETLIGIEVMLSTILLFMAGLLISSLFHLLHVEKGFTEARAVAVDLALNEHDYASPQDCNRFFDRALADVRAIPGVKSAAMVMGLPLTGETQVNGIELEGSSGTWIDASKTNLLLINVRFISADYFATLGIPLLKGRPIEARDMDRRATVVSERFAAKVWPGQNPIGKKFKTGSRVGQVEVIGVVKDVHNGSLDSDPTLIAYVPYRLRGPRYGSLVAQTRANANSMMPVIRRTIWSIDSRLAVPPFVTMKQLVDDSAAMRRFQMQLSSAFGAAALCLALIGVYGVVAFNISARKTEIGIRLALGARAHKLVALMMWRGLRPALMGVAVGLAISISCGWLIRSLLFEVQVVDPLIVTGVSSLLVLASALACFVPASAAARADPSTAIRYE